MSEPERVRDAMAKAVEAVTPDPALSRHHPAEIRSTRADRTVDVDLADGGPMPRASGASVVYGLPAVHCVFRDGARGRLAFDNGDPRRRFFGSFDSFPPVLDPEGPIVPPNLPVDEINICGAQSNQGAARNGDEVSSGTLTWAPTPPVGGIPTGGILTYTPAPSLLNPVPIPTVLSVVGPIVITQVSPPPDVPGTVSIQLAGAISGGSSVVKIGG